MNTQKHGENKYENPTPQVRGYNPLRHYAKPFMAGVCVKKPAETKLGVGDKALQNLGIEA